MLPILEARAVAGMDCLNRCYAFCKSLAAKAVSHRLVLLILLVVLAVYLKALCGSFVFDDIPQVLENGWIREVTHIPDMFAYNVRGFQGETSSYYRPLMHVIYLVNYHLFGLKPWGFHLVNVLFHAASSVLVFLITSRLLREAPLTSPASPLLPSLAAALLFATHPVHTEPVIYIAALPDISYTFFYLLSFYFYMRSFTDGDPAYIVSVESFFLATLCKEPALTLPVILLAYDSLFPRGGTRPLDRLKRYLPYLAAAAVYFVVRLSALDGLAPEKHHAGLSTYHYVINAFPLFARYLATLILPLHLNDFYLLTPISSLAEPKGIGALAATAAFLVLGGITLRKRHKTAFLALAFVAVPLLPALYIPGISWNGFAERYLYLPSVGFVLLIAYGIAWAGNARPKRGVALLAVAAVLTGVYALGSMNRGAVWKDECTLWEDTVRNSPENAESHAGFGDALYRQGRVAEAMEQYRIARELAEHQAP